MGGPAGCGCRVAGAGGGASGSCAHAPADADSCSIQAAHWHADPGAGFTHTPPLLCRPPPLVRTRLRARAHGLKEDGTHGVLQLHPHVRQRLGQRDEVAAERVGGQVGKGWGMREATKAGQRDEVAAGGHTKGRWPLRGVPGLMHKTTVAGHRWWHRRQGAAAARTPLACGGSRQCLLRSQQHPRGRWAAPSNSRVPRVGLLQLQLVPQGLGDGPGGLPPRPAAAAQQRIQRRAHFLLAHILLYVRCAA